MSNYNNTAILADSREDLAAALWYAVPSEVRFDSTAMTQHVQQQLNISAAGLAEHWNKFQLTGIPAELTSKLSAHDSLRESTKAKPVPYEKLSDSSARFLLMQAMPVATDVLVPSRKVNASVATLFIFDSKKTKTKFTQQMARARRHLLKKDYITKGSDRSHSTTVAGLLRYKLRNVHPYATDGFGYDIPALPASQSEIGHGFEHHAATVFAQSAHFSGQVTNIDSSLYTHRGQTPVFSEQVHIGSFGPLARERRIDLLASPCEGMTHNLGIQLKAGHHSDEPWIPQVLEQCAAHSELKLPTVIIVDGPAYTTEVTAKYNEYYADKSDAYPFFSGMFTITEFMQKLDSEGWSAFE